jgi:hypothetical protein
LDRAPPNWDDSWYLSNSLTLYDAWTSGGLLGLAGHFLAALGFKAPLITALPLPFYRIFGPRWHFAFLVNLAAMLALYAAFGGWQPAAQRARRPDRRLYLRDPAAALRTFALVYGGISAGGVRRGSVLAGDHPGRSRYRASK